MKAKPTQSQLDALDSEATKLENNNKAIVNRLKEQRKDLSVLLKYADEAQQQKLASLGFDFSEPQKEGNAIATIAFDLIIKAKDHQLTNEALYEGYVKSLKNKEEAVNYAAFNIKCRSLFNTQKLLRKKSKDTKSSKEDMISLNGRALHKESKEKS